MAINTKKTRVLMKTDTTSNWEKAANFIPLPGEICIYSDAFSRKDENGDLFYIPGIKIGDGNTLVNNLPFVNSTTEAISLDKIREITGTEILSENEVEY